MQANKIEWLVTGAAAIAATLAVLSLGDGTILALAAATHALTLVP